MKHDEDHLEKVAAQAPEPDDVKLAERHVAAWAETLDRAARGGMSSLDADERIRFERALAEDAALREALDDVRFSQRFFSAARESGVARETSQRLRDSILQSIDTEELATSRPVSRRTSAPRPRRSRAWFVHAMTAAAAVVLLAVVLPSQLQRSRPGTVVVDGQVYTAAEVQAATDQVEMALALLSRTVDRTSTLLRSEMTQELREHLAEPLERGFERSVESIPYLQPVPRENEHSSRTSPPRDLHGLGLESNGSLERT